MRLCFPPLLFLSMIFRSNFAKNTSPIMRKEAKESMKIFKVIGVVAFALTGVASLLSDFAQQQEFREIAREEVDRAFSEKTGESK